MCSKFFIYGNDFIFTQCPPIFLRVIIFEILSCDRDEFFFCNIKNNKESFTKSSENVFYPFRFRFLDKRNSFVARYLFYISVCFERSIRTNSFSEKSSLNNLTPRGEMGHIYPIKNTIILCIENPINLASQNKWRMSFTSRKRSLENKTKGIQVSLPDGSTDKFRVARSFFKSAFYSEKLR